MVETTPEHFTPRGIEHVGVVVPDLRIAEAFFEAAFGATVLYRMVEPGEVMDGAEMTSANGFPETLKLVGLSQMRLGNGPNVELFEIDHPNGESVGMAHMGLTHFSVYVDDIDKAGTRFTEAGGLMFKGPNEAFHKEAGPGNATWFGTTPWGMLIELISLPSELDYDDGAPSRWFPN